MMRTSRCTTVVSSLSVLLVGIVLASPQAQGAATCGGLHDVEHIVRPTLLLSSSQMR
jgi:hypothetical protein